MSFNARTPNSTITHIRKYSALAQLVNKAKAGAIGMVNGVLYYKTPALNTVAFNGTLFSSTTSSTTTGTVEETLASYSLLGSALGVNGRGVRITAAGTFAATANAKSVRLYFGATAMCSTTFVTGSPNALSWRLTADVLRSGAATQVYSSVTAIAAIAAWYSLAAGMTETLSSAVLIKVTGTTAVAAGDATLTMLLVEAI